jgi:hypothetical protein
MLYGHSALGFGAIAWGLLLHGLKEAALPVQFLDLAP